MLTGALFVCGCRDAILVSSSMTPTIKQGEQVTVDYTAYKIGTPKRWDVVAFEPPGLASATGTRIVWLMRVVALPGETVGFSMNSITVNGQPLSLPAHVTNVTYLSLDKLGQPPQVTSPYVVPADSFFVLGDNSANANDSRFWGAVPRTNIVGRVRNK